MTRIRRACGSNLANSQIKNFSSNAIAMLAYSQMAIVFSRLISSWIYSYKGVDLISALESAQVSQFCDQSQGCNSGNAWNA